MNLPTRDEAVKGAQNLSTIAEIYTNNTGGKSITKATKDLMCQFPIVMTNSIEYNKIYPIVKAFEKNYAMLMFSAISSEGSINRDKSETIQNFIRKYHTNIALPNGAMESFGEYGDDGEIKVTGVVTEGRHLTNDDIAYMADALLEQLDCSKINDIYRPYDRSEARLRKCVDTKLQAAMEADEMFFRIPEFEREAPGKPAKGAPAGPLGLRKHGASGTNSVAADRNGKGTWTYIKAPTDPKEFARLKAKHGEAYSMNEWNNVIANTANIHNDGEVLRDDAFAALTPTSLKLTISNIKANVGIWQHTFIVGIKTMPRITKSGALVNDLCDAYRNKPIFKFIRWSNGEYKTLDMIFGITAARESASAGKSKWVKVLRGLALRSKIPFIGKNVNPITSIIITDIEAKMIKDACGIDPNDAGETVKMMKKHSLLAFAIFDDEANMLKVMYDGDGAFTTVSLRTMIADVNKQLTLDNSRN